MATINHNNSFQDWILTPQELNLGSILTTLQKQCIQNQITKLAHERINLSFDPNNSSLFVQQDAALKGQVIALTYLLDLSALAEVEYSSPSSE